MDVVSILQMVSTMGFPAIMCILVCWYVKYMMDAYRDDIDKISAIHKEETDEIRKAVENNTQAIIKLCEKLN